jgi:hypothetical protein
MVYQQRTPLSEPLARARHGMLMLAPPKDLPLLAADAAVHQNHIHVSGCRAYRFESEKACSRWQSSAS